LAAVQVCLHQPWRLASFSMSFANKSEGASMLNRICKVAFTTGLVLGVLAIILVFTGSHYSHQSTGDSGFRMSVRLDAGHGSMSVILGSLSIALLVSAAVLLVVSKQTPHNDRARTFGEFLQKLHRSESDCKVAGICGGLADGTPIPSWAWRMLFLVLTFCFGVGVPPYIILWLCLPVQKIQAP
jgi:phage shock protein C